MVSPIPFCYLEVAKNLSLAQIGHWGKSHAVFKYVTLEKKVPVASMCAIYHRRHSLLFLKRQLMSMITKNKH